MRGLANKHHQAAKAKAKAAKHFRDLFSNYKGWVTDKDVGKQATTSSVCGTSGCKACSAKAHFSYTKAHYQAKTDWVE